LIPSVSYGIAIAANNITMRPGQKIIVLDQQYPSNIYAWREAAKRSGAEIVAAARQQQTWTEAVLAHIDSATAVVAIPNCHWTDGTLLNLEEIAEATRRVNAALVIDASQSLGVYPLDISKIKPDFLVTVGYKWLLGPYGLGYLYADKKYFTGQPIEFSWLNKKNCRDFSRLAEYTDEYEPGARRFDMGEFSSFIHIPMAMAALTQIHNWGIVNIRRALISLTEKVKTMADHTGLETTNHEIAGHITGLLVGPERALNF
jgi:selenocysteine lyase/cysteine desulfurase